MGDTKDMSLRHRHLIDVSGAIVGGPVLELVAIERALEKSVDGIQVSSTDPDSPVGRCVAYLSGEMASLAPHDAVISFVRNGRDLYMLSLRHVPEAAGEVGFHAHLSILEPLSVSRARRMVAVADVRRRVAPGGDVTFQVAVPVRPPDERIVPSYEGLVLLDKVLTRLAVPPHSAEDVDVAWAG